MNGVRRLVLVFSVVVAFGAGLVVQKYGDFFMGKTQYTQLNEPLLLSVVGQTKYYHLLPAGTPLYFDESFPEGYTRYKVYINIKGAFASEPIESDKVNLVAPIFAATIKKDEVQQLVADTPISKDDLVSILKARKMTRDELVQLVRDWKE